MNIITPDLMGGLGNQLFQICSAYGIAKELGFELKLPDKTLDSGKWKYYGYLFDFPKVDIQKIEYNHYLQEKSHQDIRPELKKLNGNVRIHAYLQKYIYFSNHVSELQTMLLPIEHIQPLTLALHVRSGDYKYLSEYHTNLSAEYYQEACCHMFRDPKVSNFKIYSDDLSYAEHLMNNYLREDYIRTLPSISSPKSELNDFNQIRGSDYIITGNSTFSLMSAILGNPFKVVVPDESIWFGPKNKHLDTSGMIPENYIRIKTM